MTENEARFLTGESPMETAAHLLWFTGRKKAQRMAMSQISLLTIFRPLTFANWTACQFWREVLFRLNTTDGLCSPLAPSPRRIAALKCIEERMRA